MYDIIHEWLKICIITRPLLSKNPNCLQVTIKAPGPLVF